MKTIGAMVTAVAMLLCAGEAHAQYYPDRYGYAWYPRQYAEGYYRAPYYGGGMPYCYSCGGRYPYTGPSWHYARPHYQQFHYRHADRDGWAYNRGFGRW